MAKFSSVYWNVTEKATTQSESMECDHHAYPMFSYVIRVPLMVPVIIFGLASNVINILVFRHERMRTSMVNWYLVALSATDIGVLLGSFCMLSLPVICEDAGSLEMFNLGVRAQRWTYAFSLTMQTASVGITVLVGGHRFLGVCFPFKAQRLCTARKVQVAMCIVVIFAITFNMPRWFELKVVACQSSLYNSTATLLLPTELRDDQFYNSIYFIILYTLVMFAFPFLFLIIINAMIVRTVHRSYRLRQMLTNKITTTSTIPAVPRMANVSKRRKEKKYLPVLSPLHTQRSQTIVVDCSTPSSANATAPSSNVKENKTTIMLIAVVFMFLICNSLAFINNIIELLDITGPAYSYSVDISNFLVCINSASNCFIYLTFSARYRVLVRRYIHYICCCLTPISFFCCGKKKKSRYPSTTGSIRNSAMMQLVIERAQKSPNPCLLKKGDDNCDDVTPCLSNAQFPNHKDSLNNCSASPKQKTTGNCTVGMGSIRRTNSQCQRKPSCNIPIKHKPQEESNHCEPYEALILNNANFINNSGNGTPKRRRASTISVV